MADKQTQNPFDEFQPSWLKKAQAKSFESAARPATPLTDEDILFQELIAPLRTTNNQVTQISEPTPYNSSISDSYSSPSGVPAYFATPTTAIEPYNYTPITEIAPIVSAPAPTASEKPSKTVKKPKSKTAKPPRNKGWWTRELLILAVVVMVIVLGYVGYVELQGSQRTANSVAAKDVDSIAHFPNSYGIVLTNDEYKNFALTAINTLDNVDKYACYHSSNGGSVIQNFYSDQLEKQNYSSVDVSSQNSYQNWGWISKSQDGVILTTYSVGWFDNGLFNRAAPGETVFCIFKGKMSSQSSATSPATNNHSNPPAPAPASGGGDNGSSNNVGDNPVYSPPPIKPAPSTAPPNQPAAPAPTTNSQPQPQGTPAAGHATPTVPPTPTKPPLPTPTTNPLDKGA